MKISIIQIPYDSGKFNERMGCGPLVLTDAAFIDWLKSEGHKIGFFKIRLPDDFIFDTAASKYIQREVKKFIEVSYKANSFPLIFAGNCNYAAFGTLSGFKDIKTGVFWFDAHGDFNTPETSISGFFDGMALSILTGNSWNAFRKSMEEFKSVPEENVILLGVRDLDNEERILLDKSKIQIVTVNELELKPADIISDVYFKPLTKRVEQIYLHIDLDVLDIYELKANQYSSADGLKLKKLLEIISSVKKILKISAVSFTAYDPRRDENHQASEIVKAILKVFFKN